MGLKLCLLVSGPLSAKKDGALPFASTLCPSVKGGVIEGGADLETVQALRLCVKYYDDLFMARCIYAVCDLRKNIETQHVKTKI